MLRGGAALPPGPPPPRHPAAGGEAAFPPGPPHPATWRPPTPPPSSLWEGVVALPSGPSRFRSVRDDLDHCNAGVHFNGIALRRSRLWMHMIRACRQVLRSFVVGMRRNFGRSRNPFVCFFSPCARPDPIRGLHRQDRYTNRQTHVAHRELYIKGSDRLDRVLHHVQKWSPITHFEGLCHSAGNRSLNSQFS